MKEDSLDWKDLRVVHNPLHYYSCTELCPELKTVSFLSVLVLVLFLMQFLVSRSGMLVAMHTFPLIQALLSQTALKTWGIS